MSRKKVTYPPANFEDATYEELVRFLHVIFDPDIPFKKLVSIEQTRWRRHSVHSGARARRRLR